MPSIPPTLYSSSPIVQLADFTGKLSPAVLQRIPNMTADQGANGSQFDEMLRRWVGGTGITNTFQLVDVLVGTHDLYLYTGSLVVTKFTVTVNGGTPQIATATPTGVRTFAQNNNFVVFRNLVVPLTKRANSPEIYTGGMIEIKVEGTISGLQLRRL
jgi:hypothetical protein